MAATRQHLHHLWRRRGGSATTSAVVGLVFLVFSAVGLFVLTSRSPESALNSTESILVDLTLVNNAKEKGALCLDGTLPGYHFLKGFGSGADKWLIHLEGGGWCRNLELCSARKQTELGSSNHMEKQVPFIGILSNLPSQNPDFYNWNKVKVRYCDGASFSGDVETTEHKGTTLYFRGLRIWEAIMDDLLLKGLANAKKALLTGCSAGGLATYIHCDDFKALLPKTKTVKCMADGGFFLDVNDISGRRSMYDSYNEVVHLQCFFPEEIIKKIRTPFFILNPAYDAWQVQHVVTPDVSGPSTSWRSCRLDIKKCDSNQIEVLQGMRTALLDGIRGVTEKKDWGIFVDSCFIHCQSLKDYLWHSPNSPRINNKTIAEAVGDWYFDRSKVKEIDGQYPSNPSCYNLVFSQPYKL
ncbi:pectin acetylesterase 5-like protein [Carex littledalei]|uniref:Pectin acetylesterase n=1 Tax=Carex littledalei TaxID=544730 RepID=A0A833R720_9POAL|nr:pectin acetylesterase 5-like protein [Carex littledalei]